MSKIEQISGGLGVVEGFFCDACNVGMRQGTTQGDVAFIRSNEPLDVSAVFTTNRFQAAPIKHYQRYPKDFQTNFVLINAKNANAMTGKRGIEDIDTIFEHLPSKLDVLNPIMSSTGVIGYRLPIPKIVSAFDMLDFQATNSTASAKAIMTTDSFEKEFTYEVYLNEKDSFKLSIVAKGAGMIAPSLATMLCFIVTDANIPKQQMDIHLKNSVKKSFNAISVDGDTSTNDTLMLLSNKKSGTYDKDAFREALNKITFELAMMILRDGEGANKLIAFEVKGATTIEDAQKASRALSNSLLVKTALFGEDPNWGRIASTIGASGVECDDEKLTIHYDDLLIYSDEFRELDSQREESAYKIMKQDSFKIICDLGLGDASYISYGCDLSYEYVKINAEYRT